MISRIRCAFLGIWMPSASSTARTEVSAWLLVHTPQMRSTKAQASRGSRPLRMTSSPRQSVPVDTALRITLLLSRLTSQRICPSMRVTGSTTMRLPLLSSAKGSGRWRPWCVAPCAGSVVGLGRLVLVGGALEHGHRRMRRHGCAHGTGRGHAHLVGVGLDTEGVDVGGRS